MTTKDRKAPSAPFAALDLEQEDEFSASLAAFGPRRVSPPVPVATLERISEAAGFPPRGRAQPAPAPEPMASRPSSSETGRAQVKGRRKRQLTGRNYTFSVRLRPEDAQRIYDLVDSLHAETVADVVEAALAALDEKLRRDGLGGRPAR